MMYAHHGSSVSKSPRSNTPRSHAGILRRLTRSDPCHGSLDLLELERAWSKVPVSSRLPERIALRVELAKDLYRYSYFRYGFRDSAFLYILLAYEAALRDVFPKQARTDDLELLIDSADKAGLIPDRHPAWKVHALRRMRNAHMHGQVYAPLLFTQEHILQVIDLINCVFDEEARVVIPPLYVPRFIAKKRQKNLIDGLSAAPHNSLKPGDFMVIAGTEDTYPAGMYTCLQCGKDMQVRAESRQLPLCRRRGCRCGSFRFVPATTAAVPGGDAAK